MTVTFPIVGCDWPVNFSNWISRVNTTEYSSVVRVSPELIRSVFSLIVLGECSDVPTSGDITIMSLYSKGNGPELYPGQVQRVPFTDIVESINFPNPASPQGRFSIVFENPRPRRCDGFVIRNNLDVNIGNIFYAYVPIIDVVSIVDIER